MPEQKVSQMTPVTTPLSGDADVLNVVQGGNSLKAKVKDFGGHVVATAIDSLTITETAMNYMLVFTRQASDKTITLPNANGNIGQKITIVVTGTGAGNVLLDGTLGQKINGILITDFVFHGTGTLKLVSDGTQYFSQNCVYDMGELSSTRFKKMSNGCCEFTADNIQLTNSNNETISGTFTFPFSLAETTYKTVVGAYNSNDVNHNLTPAMDKETGYPLTLSPLVSSVTILIRFTNTPLSATPATNTAVVATKIDGKWGLVV